MQEISRVGRQCDDGKVMVEYGKLQESSEGVFEALLGTLLTARKQKVFVTTLV